MTTTPTLTLDVARIRLDVAQSRFEDQFQHNVLADKPAEHFLGIGDQRIEADHLGPRDLAPAKCQQLRG